MVFMPDVLHWFDNMVSMSEAAKTTGPGLVRTRTSEIKLRQRTVSVRLRSHVRISDRA
jgi:hypothetical protein